MTDIETVRCWQELDSRGAFTLAVEVTAGPHAGQYSVPGSALGGRAERAEWEETVEDATALVADEITPALAGLDVTAQRSVDEIVDGTVGDSTAATIAAHGVSCAVAQTGTHVTDTPLFEYLAENGAQIPEPVVNVIGGGADGARAFGIQHLAVRPVGRASVESAIRDGRAVRDAVRERILDDGQEPLVDSEGSFVPAVSSPGAAFEMLVASIEDAGFRPAVDDVAIVVDFAGGRLYHPDRGGYPVGDSVLDGDELAAEVVELARQYPVVTIEDPLRAMTAQWRRVADEVPSHVDILGDEIRGETRAETLSAIESGALSAVLVKPDRYGTVTNSLDIAREIANAGATPVISARAGDSGSTVPADISIAVPGSNVKIGSLDRFERTAKFNRLLLAERETDLPYAGE
ncbi:enolase C-terminal domain-like protein [Halovenus marina]|uniref:enolase C-terminal domain-like protein n=1 Tax=Halovenus marina TaxID=3396621 RepID=UPI003F567DC4